jgi:hypothetical protein
VIEKVQALSFQLRGLSSVGDIEIGCRTPPDPILALLLPAG